MELKAWPDDIVVEKNGTKRDAHDMARMGKLQELRGLVVLNHPDYVPQRWHGSLIAISLVLFSLLNNTVLAQKLPLIEGVILILHIGGFIAILVPLWVLAPLSSAHNVFTSFNDGGDWHSTGLAVLVGILSPQLALIGPDAAVHMSEEVRNASKTIPRIMLATMCINGAMGFIMLITLCFCVGNLEDVLDTATGYPFIQVFHNVTPRGATTMASILVILSQFCAVTNMATASRQLFSFARDQGVPFHDFFQKVRPGLDIPLNAVLATSMFSILLICISFGSTIAFNQLTALGTVALLSSYMVSIGSMALLRIRGRPLLKCHFSLGRYGLAINILALLFLALSFVMVCFPPARDPTLQGMNWSIVIFSGVMVLSGVYYRGIARHKYAGPVKLVKTID
ncbi:MAG: hypothetical protein L6R39_000602 [Caloplaca ligustica]|nr:MAG: hypothetical protein L6R39_000602 [Caloplaca ligustica]